MNIQLHRRRIGFAAVCLASAFSARSARGGAADSPFHWKNPAGGSWPVGSNWLENFAPNSVESIGIFGPVNLGPVTVNLNAAITMGELHFDSAFPYTIAAGTGGSMTLNGFVQPAVIEATGTGSSVTANIVLPDAHGLTANLAANASVLLSGDISGIAGITNSGAGTLTLGGNNSFGGGLDITDGSIVLNSPGALPNGSSLAIHAGKITAADQGANPKIVLQTNSLKFGGTTTAWIGQLDLTTNDMIVHGGNLGTVTNQIKQGSAGNWSGQGIISSAAAASSSPKTALGYGTNLSGTFDGQTIAPTDVVVKYTLAGDANLDGSVNFNDLLIVAQHYNANNTTWQTGDFNYDGTTNFNDLLALAQNYNKGLSLTASQEALLDSSGGSSFMSAFAEAEEQALPEPSILILGLAIPLLCRRRRRI